MPWVVARIVDGRLRASRWDELAFDRATEVRFECPDMPNPATQRWDGDVGMRAATQSEIDAVEAASPVNPDVAGIVQVIATRLSIPRATLLAEVVSAIKTNRGRQPDQDKGSRGRSRRRS